MVNKGKWKTHDVLKTCIESENGMFLDTIGHVNLWQDRHVEHMLACVNACRGLHTKELQEHGIYGAVGNELLIQDEIIKNLISLVEHYGKCYNHNLEDYVEYVSAIKYLDNK